MGPSASKNGSGSPKRPVGHPTQADHSVIDTLEHTLKEAKERIPWISATGLSKIPRQSWAGERLRGTNARPVDPARSRVRKQKASQSAGRAIVTKQAPARYDVLGSGAWC